MMMILNTHEKVYAYIFYLLPFPNPRESLTQTCTVESTAQPKPIHPCQYIIQYPPKNAIERSQNSIPVSHPIIVIIASKST